MVQARPRWRGVSLDTLLADVDTSAEFAVASSYGGYTTNLPVADLLDGQAWIAHRYDGEDRDPEHGGPRAAAGAAPVPLEERQVAARDHADDRRRARLLGDRRLHNEGDPWREQRYWDD